MKIKFKAVEEEMIYGTLLARKVYAYKEGSI